MKSNKQKAELYQKLRPFLGVANRCHHFKLWSSRRPFVAGRGYAAAPLNADKGMSVLVWDRGNLPRPTFAQFLEAYYHEGGR